LLYLAAQIGDFINIFIHKASPGVQYNGITPIEVVLYVVGKFFHAGITLGIPVYLHGWDKIWLHLLRTVALARTFCAGFFMVSHNLDGLRPQQLSHLTQKDWGQMAN
jgi:hypothetical protein